MNREHWKELLPVITAFANGEKIESNFTGEWQELRSAEFNGRPEYYRIAPKQRKVWVNEYEGNNFNIHNSREQADAVAFNFRIACHELELPPLP
jgi:hypothetical protein